MMPSRISDQLQFFFFFLNCLPERETEKGCSCAQTELNISDAVATVLNLSFHLF